VDKTDVCSDPEKALSTTHGFLDKLAGAGKTPVLLVPLVPLWLK